MSSWLLNLLTCLFSVWMDDSDDGTLADPLAS